MANQDAVKAGTLSIHFKLVLVQLFWAGTFVASEIALITQPPALTALVRFILTTSGYILLCISMPSNFSDSLWVRCRQVSLLQWIALTMMGVFCVTVYTLLLHLGLESSTAAYAALLIPTTQPIFTAILSRVILKGALTASLIAGLALGFVGATLIVVEGFQDSNEKLLLGNLTIILAALSFSVYAVSARFAPPILSSTETTTISFLIGTLALCPMPFFFSESYALTDVTWSFWLSIAYLVIFATILPYLWWNQAVKEIGSTQTGVYTFLMPPLAIILAMIILNHQPSIIEIFGGLLAMSGVALATLGIPDWLKRFGFNRPVPAGLPNDNKMSANIATPLQSKTGE